MSHWIEYCFRGYFWVAALGFPLALPWALQNKHDMKTQYFTGYENGWSECDKQHDEEYPDCEWSGGIIE